MVYNNETSSSKKKMLVPLVVLLLCGVALTGSAYAYTSKITDDTSVATETDSDLKLTMVPNANGKLYFDIVRDDVTGKDTYTVNAADSAKIIKITINTKMTTIGTPVVTVYSDEALSKEVTAITATATAFDGKVSYISFTGTAMDSIASVYYLKVVVDGQVAVTSTTPGN